MLTGSDPTFLLADSNASAEQVQNTATNKAANSPICEWIIFFKFAYKPTCFFYQNEWRSIIIQNTS